MTFSVGLNTLHPYFTDSDTQTHAVVQKGIVGEEVPWVAERDRPMETLQSCGMVCTDIVEDSPSDRECTPISEEDVQSLFEQDSLLRVLKARLATCEHDLRWDFYSLVSKHDICC